MNAGILVCGLNGCGKSTLGRALAERLKLRFLDDEAFFFSGNTGSDPFAHPRTHEEVARLLTEAVGTGEGFVYAAVKGDRGEAVRSRLTAVVLLEVPRALRLSRVRRRSEARFGSRALPGGDLYEREQAFFERVSARSPEDVRTWAYSLGCPVIEADGALEVAGNVERIVGQLTAAGCLPEQ